MMRLLYAILLFSAVAVGLLWAADLGLGPVVITKEYEFKIVQLFGDPVDEIVDPGPSWRIPFITEVKTFDRRLQYLNAKPVELLIANNEKLIVDYYATWKIIRPLAFLRAFPNGVEQAEGRIKRSINSAVQAQIAKLSLNKLLARAEILSQLGESTSAELESDGVRIVDIRINRTELPRTAESSAYAQMQEQRRAVSRDRRAVGDRQAREIRAEANRKARTEIAGAKAAAQVRMGEGDAEAARIYADAYGRAPEFYSFIRSLEAYRKTLGDGTVMVLPPDHEFFRFLQPERTFDERREGQRSGPPPVSSPPPPVGTPPPVTGSGAQ